MKSVDSFQIKKEIRIGSKIVTFFSLRALEKSLGYGLARLPFSLRILLENLLRCEDGRMVRKEDIEKLVRWNSKTASDSEIAFMPARVLLQDFTGVPCIVDLAVMRDAMVKIGEDPGKINPLLPVDLVIDHSLQVDEYGTSTAIQTNANLEFERNRERYSFLRWGQQAFKNFRVVPPDTGIVHQVNLEYLASIVFTSEEGGSTAVYPDTVVGTDSHTTMINGLGVLGWGVGGIEAEAAMLGQPISMLIPQVIGIKLRGKLLPGVTATDLVLMVTQMLRKKGVVGKFVEFFGPGLVSLPLADRATIANMAPEYGATMGFFPVDAETIKFLRLTGRSEEQVTLIETYLKEQGLFWAPDSPEPEYSEVVELNLTSIEANIAGPKRPQERIPLSKSKPLFRSSLVDTLLNNGVAIDRASVAEWVYYSNEATKPDFLKSATIEIGGTEHKLEHGSVVIAAITSCTNTSNPNLIITAGLLAKKAVEKGLKTKPWVKTSLAPGSKVVAEYLRDAKLMEPLEALGFHIVGYGCTTCIGNSGPLPEAIGKAIQENGIVTAAVLSGNRNFEGRVNPLTQANYLASPPLVIAFALAGTMDVDFIKEPIGTGPDGAPILLKDIWPTPQEIEKVVRESLKPEFFKHGYSNVFEGDENWQNLSIPTGAQYEWEHSSTYIKQVPFFDDFSRDPKPLQDIYHARVLALLGDSITTDHISPAGTINEKTPAGRYLLSLGIQNKNFNQYGTRRGNHEVMVRGTFANIRLKNLLVPGIEGGVTSIHPSSRDPMSIFDASLKYKEGNIPLIIVAGKEYGSGSSRDWAAKGPALLGVKAVIAESFERIHRANLVGMGILPLEFTEGQSFRSLDLSGFEAFDIEGITNDLKPRKKINVTAISQDGTKKSFPVICRIDTPNEIEYYKHGGILQYVLRSLLKPVQSTETQAHPKSDANVQKYRIVFSGELEPGYELPGVKGQLAQLFKTPVAQVERFFIGRPVIINTNLTHAAASDYVLELKKIGALCYFEPIQAPLLPQQQAAAPAMKSPAQRPMQAKPGVAAAARPVSVKSGSKTKTEEQKIKAPSISISKGLFTAVLMILLFLIYPFLILLGAITLFGHIIDNTVIFDEYSLVAGLCLYFLPAFAGIMILISMLKPFIARPAKKQFSIPIMRKKEQGFAGYIDKICSSLSFRSQVNIELDYSNEVKLRYKGGFAGFLENNLMLTIGLPVISEMNMTELASLVGAEVGHFTEKIRLQLYFLISGMTNWFTRVATEEDQADDKLSVMSSTSGPLVSGLAVPIARLFIWLTRKILFLFMIAAKKLGSSYIRQAELDSDRASIRLAGFEAFESSLGKLSVVSNASKKAFAKLRTQKQPTDSSLPNNFIQLISTIIHGMSPDEIIKIKGAGTREIGETKKKLPVRDRLDFARNVSSKPTFTSDQPAASLFVNFEDTALTSTSRLYKESLGIQFEPGSLVPTENFLTSLQMYETTKPTVVATPPSRTIDETTLGDIIESGESDSNPFF